MVLDEWRQRYQSFEGRVGVATEKLMLTGSGYENREPIGTDAAINAMTPDLLRRFYDTWYRPDNAAIMVVGDIDVDEVETEIRERFEPLKARGESDTSSRTRARHVRHARRDRVDRSRRNDRRRLDSLPGQYIADNTVASRRQSTLVSLAITMIATRLTDDVSRGVAPFVSSTTDNNGVVRRLDAAERCGQRRARTAPGIARGADAGVRAGAAVWLRRRGARSCRAWLSQRRRRPCSTGATPFKTLISSPATSTTS